MSYDEYHRIIRERERQNRRFQSRAQEQRNMSMDDYKRAQAMLGIHFHGGDPTCPPDNKPDKRLLLLNR